jgi:hypothetical protein
LKRIEENIENNLQNEAFKKNSLENQINLTNFRKIMNNFMIGILNSWINLNKVLNRSYKNLAEKLSKTLIGLINILAK